MATALERGMASPRTGLSGPWHRSPSCWPDTVWLLATPSAPLFRCISACLLDCDDAVRIARLRARGPEWWEASAGRVSDYLSWARWFRRYAEDPAWEPGVIRHDDGPDGMHWERWNDWSAGDSRWRVRVIDTSTLSVEETADQLSDWIEEERSLCRSGRHPLSGWATSTRDSVPLQHPPA